MSVTLNQPNRRVEQKARTRVALLNAASDCFADQGYAATHVAHIARRAKVAHGTFYVHFSSKQAALDALLERFNADLRAQVGDVLASGGTLEERVEAAAGRFLGACVRDAPLVRAYAERAAGGVAIEELTEGINPAARELLQAALRSVVPEEDVDLVAHGLLALWLRVALRVLYRDADVEHAARTLRKMSLGAVRALGEAAS